MKFPFCRNKFNKEVPNLNNSTDLTWTTLSFTWPEGTGKTAWEALSSCRQMIERRTELCMQYTACCWQYTADFFPTKLGAANDEFGKGFRQNMSSTRNHDQDEWTPNLQYQSGRIFYGFQCICTFSTSFTQKWKKFDWFLPHLCVLYYPK
jgi:hypothetical protein